MSLRTAVREKDPLFWTKNAQTVQKTPQKHNKRAPSPTLKPEEYFMFARLLLLAALLGLSAPMLAQTGHPAKGSWSGDLMTSGSSDKTRTRLLIDAWNGELSGVVNPGRNAVEASTVLDPSTWTLTIRAPMPDGELVLTGKLSNLGSWDNRRYIGTWTKGTAKGDFAFTLN
jgi:hypothetical protein